HLSFCVFDEKLPDLVDVGAIIPFGLNKDLPLASETVEVIDEVATHKSLQSLVNGLRVEALLKYLLPIDVEKNLRNERREHRDDTGQLRSLAGSRDKLSDLLGEKSDILAGTILHYERHAATGADAGNCRRREGKGAGARDFVKCRVHVLEDGVVFLIWRLAFFPFLQRNEENAAVESIDAAENCDTVVGGQGC